MNRWAVFGAPVNKGALRLNASPVMVDRRKEARKCRDACS
jgi:hypothetical protein